MAYLGQQPVVGRYILLDQISGGFNGTTSGFTMSTAGGAQGVIPGLAQNVLLSLGGVIQQPGVDYTISGSGLTFTTPPVSGTTFFATVLGDAQSVGTPSDGTVTPASIASGYNFAFPNLNVTGVVTIASGSAASPSLTITGDLNTGLYSPGADQVAISTSGTGRLFVDASGRVGVGTSAAASFDPNGDDFVIGDGAGSRGLTLYSNSTGNGSIYFADSTSGTDKYVGSILYRHADNSLAFTTSAQERLRITSDGKVGLGTSVPANIFHAHSASSNSSIIQLTNNTTGVGAGDGMQIVTSDSEMQIRNRENGVLNFWTNNTKAITIDTSQRLGVGTTTPAYKCDIDVTGSALRLNSTTSQALLVISSDDAANAKIEFGDESDNDRGAITYDNPNNALIFQANAAERLRIDSSGRVGIGTSSPNSLLTLDNNADSASISTSAGDYQIRLRAAAFNTYNGGICTTETTTSVVTAAISPIDTGVSAAQGWAFITGNNSAIAERMRIDSSGRVGIGTTSPGCDLEIGGDGHIHLADQGRVGCNSGSGAPQDAYVKFYDSDIIGFHTTDAERARIDSSGRLLVGTSSGTGNIMLHVVKSGTVNTRVESSSFADTNVCSHGALAGGRLAEIGVYKHSGITNAGTFIRLDEEDGTLSFLWVDNSGNLRIGSDVNFVGTTSGTVVGTQTSDERIKNILGPVEYGLEIIKQIEPVRYTLKTEPNTEKLGFIAQQVQPLIPQSVFDTNEHIEGETEDAPTKLGMEYVALIPVLVNAIKELSAEVEALKSQLQ